MKEEKISVEDIHKRADELGIPWDDDDKFMRWTKKITGKPTITVGSVGLNDDFFGAFKGQDSSTRSVDDLLERLDVGEFDLVAVGRALLQDPSWANKIKEGRTDELMQYSGKSLGSLS